MAEMHSRQVMTDFEVLRVSFFKRGSDYFRFYRFRVLWGKCRNPENGTSTTLFFLRNCGRDETDFEERSLYAKQRQVHTTVN